MCTRSELTSVSPLWPWSMPQVRIPHKSEGYGCYAVLALVTVHVNLQFALVLFNHGMSGTNLRHVCSWRHWKRDDSRRVSPKWIRRHLCEGTCTHRMYSGTERCSPCRTLVWPLVTVLCVEDVSTKWDRSWRLQVKNVHFFGSETSVAFHPFRTENSTGVLRLRALSSAPISTDIWRQRFSGLTWRKDGVERLYSEVDCSSVRCSHWSQLQRRESHRIFSWLSGT